MIDNQQFKKYVYSVKALITCEKDEKSTIC